MREASRFRIFQQQLANITFNVADIIILKLFCGEKRASEWPTIINRPFRYKINRYRNRILFTNYIAWLILIVLFPFFFLFVLSPLFVPSDNDAEINGVQYCRKAPALRTCQRGMTAYTTVSLMSKSTGRMLSLNDVNHCICPGQSANYDLVDSQFDDVDDDTESMSTTYVCNPVNIYVNVWTLWSIH